MDSPRAAAQLRRNFYSRFIAAELRKQMLPTITSKEDSISTLRHQLGIPDEGFACGLDVPRSGKTTGLRSFAEIANLNFDI